jgi:hypothetical protein
MGIKRDLRVRVATRRLVIAMRKANPRLPERELSHKEIETELQAVVEAWITRWLGPPQK